MNTRNERGSVLMLVVIFSLILCLLGFAVLYMNGLEYLSARRDLLDTRASLLADAGLALGVGFLYYCDARLEDEDDMKIAQGGNINNTVRGDVCRAMQPQNGNGNGNGNGKGKGNGKGNGNGNGHNDGIYQLFSAKRVDNAYPHAWCDVWISSAVNNLASTDGYYYYRISSRGLATYGHNGVVDSVKNEEMLIRMSTWTANITTGDLYYKGGRYYYNYWVVAGRRFSEQPIERVVH